MKRLRLILTLFIILLFILIFLFFFTQRIIKKSFPQLKGDIKIEGIRAEVKIFRDDFGIPYIEAQNEDDLFFALGFVHAQDRLFQMDITRRAGMGRLSEILGSKALEFDIIFKTAGFDELAKKLYENSSSESKRICSSYTNGINEYLKKNSGNFSIEFDLLNYLPEKWQPYQVYLIARLVAWELNLGWWVDVVYAQLQSKLPLEKFNQLIPDYPSNGPFIIQSNHRQNLKRDLSLIESHNKNNVLSQSIIQLLNDFYEINSKFRIFGSRSGYSGSNSWAVSSKLSESGKPILANDPHLVYSLPSKWYIVSLNSPSLRVSGVTIPGSPSVVIGKNDSLAWGLTNLMLDDCDFFIEKLNEDGSKYFCDNEWRTLKTKIDTIKVNDSSDVIISVKSTHRGPLIQTANHFLKGFNADKAISMKWTGSELSDELLAFYKINKAKNYKEFRDGLKYFNCPAQNFLCADYRGNIYYKAAGKIPIRNYSNFLIFIDGTTTINDWTKYLDFDSLPEILNPEEGYIATNNNPPQKEFINLIGSLWEPSSRAERIHILLKSKKKFSTDDFIKFQNDVVSPYAKRMSEFVVRAFENTEIKNKNLRESINLLRTWNGELKKYDNISAVYNVFLIELLKNTFTDEMGEDLFKKFLFVGNVPLRVIYKLLHENIPDSISFFDNVSTPEIETKDEIIRRSFASAVSKLEKQFGKDMSKWQWGEIHQVKFNHLFSGQTKILDKLIDIGPFPIGGDQTTLLNTSYKFGESFENNLGPSMRQIVDLAKIDSSLIIITSGQSGHIGHKNYKDQALLWLNGEYILFETQPEKYRKHKLLKLIPNYN